MRRLNLYIEDSAYGVLADRARESRRRVQDEAALALERALARAVRAAEANGADAATAHESAAPR